MLRSTLKICVLLVSFSFLAACGGDSGPDCSDPAKQMRGAAVIMATCLDCHSVTVTGANRLSAPVGIDFDTPADITTHEDKIRTRAVDVPSMPPAANGGPLAANEIDDLENFLDCRE
jgi:uncharacterized membrane protein